jgi:hypothetical protein
MLAHHFVTALELKRAVGHEPGPLLEKARTALRAAGERAHSLQAFATAAKYYEDALTLEPADSERLDLLFGHAVAAFESFADDRERILEQACNALLEAGEVERAAELESMLAEVWWRRADNAAVREHLDRAVELLAERPSSAAKARVVGQAARYQMLGGETASALALADEALAMAESLDLGELRADILITVGTALGSSGNLDGVEQVKQGLDLALACNSLTVAGRAYHNLSSIVYQLDFRRSVEYLAESRQIARRIGGEASAAYSDSAWIGDLYWLGDWDEALRLADDFIAECEAGRSEYGEDAARETRALIRHARGDIDGTRTDITAAIALGRAANEPQAWSPALILAAVIALEFGRRDEADAYITEVLADTTQIFLHLQTVDLAFVAKDLGRASELRTFLEASPRPTLWHAAARAVLEGEDARAGDLLEELGIPTLSAHARLRAAKALAATGRRAEADEQLRAALAFFRSVGASRYVRDAEALLAAAS